MPFSGITNGAGPLACGAYTVTSADHTAGQTAINTGLTNITFAHATVIRAGKTATSDAAVSLSGGTLTIGSGSSYTITAGDVIHWLAIGQ